jgi:hypothetical protein
MAQEFADALGIAHKDNREGELLWESAFRLAGLPKEDVRVISRSGVTYLLGQDWVVYPDKQGWKVRPWRGEDDEFYEEALDIAALDDDGAL